MTRKWQIVVWLGIWCFWVAVSRNNHPTLLLNAIATAFMVAVFAAAVTINGRVLLPRYRRTKQWGLYALGLLCTMSVLTVLVVLAIQAVYDALWGPDPNRFGFWVNFGLDFFGMGVHLLGAAGVVWLLDHRKPRTETT